MVLALSGCALPAFPWSGAGARHATQTVTLTPTHDVNPFIGTAPGGTHFGFSGDSGDTFPGATYPAGMVQWSPDTPSKLPGGYYYPDTTIKGFSLTHFSGRGCTVYQDFPFMPYVGAITQSPATHAWNYWSAFSHASESAHPGYYRVHLDTPQVTVELSVTPRTGMGQFTYPASTDATMLINAGASVNGVRSAAVTIAPDNSEVTGFTRSTVGCGSNTYTIYFAAQFDVPFSSYGVWNRSGVSQGAASSNSPHAGAYVTFDTTVRQVVHVKVGVSYVSIANAQANLHAENPGWDFAAVRKSADTAWNTRLNTIQATGGSATDETIFYTALYHSFLEPSIFSDANGQYPGFDGHIHAVAQGHAQYSNIPGWDQYRSLIRLLAILEPAETSDILQSLVNDAAQGNGHLPRWVQANSDSHGMNGDDGDAYIASGYAFGVTGFDTQAALDAMLTGQPGIREGLSDEQRLGYVAEQSSGASADITLEYATDDFAIGQVAQALGNTSAYCAYRQRSGDWRHVFNTITGYIQPRNADGSWGGGFSPISGSGFQEGDAAQYTWMVPFDLRDLFGKLGGDAAVVQRLDTFFTQLNAGPHSAYAFMGNEPSFEIPWEFDYAGAPAQTQAVVRRIETSLFFAAPLGLPGNDDGGALSSWYVFAALGLYPEIPAVGGFVIGSPLFPSITVHLAGGHTLTINAPAASHSTPYVQQLALNGHPTSSLWIPWRSVKNDATLNFTLASGATNWGSSSTDAPPSFGPAGKGC
ncbi:MAG: GH92 family glycosyl hydrolase [Ktedonobacterales bacterium]